MIRYADFGAKGDGKANDFEALARAREEANRKGLPVVAEDGDLLSRRGTPRDPHPDKHEFRQGQVHHR